jgi:hypothetical protein
MEQTFNYTTEAPRNGSSPTSHSSSSEYGAGVNSTPTDRYDNKPNGFADASEFNADEEAEENDVDTDVDEEEEPTVTPQPRPGVKVPKPRKKVFIGDNNLRRITTDVSRAMQAHNNPPRNFRKNGSIVRVVIDEEKGAVIQNGTIPILRNILSGIVKLTKSQAQKEVEVIAPDYLLQDIQVNSAVKLPILNLLTNVPVFTPKGNLLTKAGYDRESQILYVPDRDLEGMAPVPSIVTEMDVKKARGIWKEPLVDFPFVGQADHDNLMALALEHIVRSLIPGLCPGHLVDASSPGSGKDLAMECCIYPTLGHWPEITAAPATDDEMRKLITSAVLGHQSVLYIGNVGRRLDSPALAAAMTSSRWGDRILGVSETVDDALRLTWGFTGNNVTLSHELSRRIIVSRLEPPMANPEDREESSFRHPQLKRWVKENRASLLWALYVMVSWWLQKGRPKANLKPLGSFEEWTEVMGGILFAAGYTSFLANRDQIKAAVDDETGPLAELCKRWFDEDKAKTDGNARTASEVLDLVSEHNEAKPIEGLRVPDNRSLRSQCTWMGWYLSKKARGRVVRERGGDRLFRINRAGDMWVCEIVGKEEK